MLKTLVHVLSYLKHFILIFPLLFLIPFSSSAQQVSKNNATGGWSSSTSWEAATSTWDTSTPLTTGIAQNVTIYGHISTIGNIDFGGASGNLIVNDTLVVNGNLTLGNNNDIIVNNNGVLIVKGDLILANNVDIAANAYIVVTGNFTKTGAANQGSFTSNDSPSKVFIGGTISVPGTWGSTGSDAVFNCSTTLEYSGTGCNFGNASDILLDPITNFVQSTCSVFPTILTQPLSVPVCSPGNAILSVAASGSNSYQWQVNTGSGFINLTNAGLYSGTNAASLTIANPTTAINSYVFRCVVRSNSGSCLSNSLTATVTVSTPVTPSVNIVSNVGSTICAGTSVTFSATPLNGGTPIYQWKKNGQNVGTNSSTYTDATLVNGDLINVVLTSGITCVTSATATSNTIAMVVVPSSVAGTISPAAGSVCTGTNSTLLTLAGNTGTIQWQSSTNNTTFTNISGANSSTYTATNLSTTTYYRAVVISGACPAATTASIVLTAIANSWVGNTNNDWSLASNWACNIVPSSPIDLTIGVLPVGKYYPVIDPGLTVSVNNLTIDNGASLTLGTNATLNLIGNFTNNGTFNSASNTGGTVNFQGTTQTISGASATSFYNVNVTGAGGSVILNSNVNVYGTVTLSNGAQLDADGSGTTPLLTLKSTSVRQAGSIGVITSGSAVNGNVKVERYMDPLGGTFRYVASPVTVSQPKPVDINKLYDYVNGWVGASSMQNGKGYAALLYNNVPVTWTVSGLTNNGSHSWPNFTAEGWYLIGNPYPSAIQWRNPNDGNVTTDAWDFTGSNNIASTIGITDNHSGTYPNYFRYYDYSLGAQTATQVIENGVVASGQAFWIYVGPGGGNLTVKQAAKSIASHSFYKNEEKSMVDQLVISISNGKTQDQAYLRMDERSTDGYEFNKDIPKLWNEYMNVYLLDKTQREMLINALPMLDESKKIPIGITVMEEGTYTLSFINADNFSMGDKLYLVDNYKGTSVPVSGSTAYSFTISDADKPLTDRFHLAIIPDVEINLNKAVSIYPNPVNDQLKIEVPDYTQNSNVILMDINGKIMISNDIKGEGIIDMTIYPEGMYILKVRTAFGLITKKIVKQ